MKIGETIKDIRISKGMKQKEFADALYVSAQAVSKWENGKTLPDLQLLPEIARVLGVNISELFK